MNRKLINRLIKEATSYEDTFCDGIGGPRYEEEVNAEKLIELVVQECVKICTEVGDIARKGCQVTEGDVCGYKIKEHFGVK